MAEELGKKNPRLIAERQRSLERWAVAQFGSHMVPPTGEELETWDEGEIERYEEEQGASFRPEERD